MAARADGMLFVADAREIRSVSSTLTSNAVAGSGWLNYRGDGPAAQAGFAGITALAFDAAGRLWAADGEANSVRRIDADGRVSTVLGVADFDLTRLGVGGWMVETGGVRLGEAPRWAMLPACPCCPMGGW